MLNSYFKLAEHGTNVRTEVIAGVTTFLTMAYITFVNPAILSDAGMDFGAVFVATCVAAPLSSPVIELSSRPAGSGGVMVYAVTAPPVLVGETGVIATPPVSANVVVG